MRKRCCWCMLVFGKCEYTHLFLCVHVYANKFRYECLYAAGFPRGFCAAKMGGSARAVLEGRGAVIFSKLRLLDPRPVCASADIL